MRRVVVLANGRGWAEDVIAHASRRGYPPAMLLETCEIWGSHSMFCFVLFALQLSVCLWWHDYRRDDFPTLKFGVVMADLARHLLREEPFALSAAPAIRAGEPGRC